MWFSLHVLFHFQVPIILHNESELARKWSKIHSKEARKQSISVITAWQLNERMYVIIFKYIGSHCYIAIQFSTETAPHRYLSCLGMRICKVSTSRKQLKN